MFILSIIPVHLPTDSDKVPVDQTNQVDVIEHTVMAIEALLTARILNEYLNANTEGIDVTSVPALSQQLEQMRSQELGLINDTWNISTNDSAARLAFVLKIQNNVGRRLQDLDLLAKAINEGSSLNYIVSGVDNTNLASVTNEKNLTENYREVLSATEQFWRQILNTENKAQELLSASKVWDQSVVNNLRTRSLDFVYDFRNQMVDSKDSAINLEASTKAWNELVQNLYQSALDEVNKKVLETQEFNISEEEKETMINSALWNKIIESQKNANGQEAESKLWELIYSGADSAKIMESKANLWSEVITNDTSTNELASSSKDWSELMQFVKQGQESEPAHILGKKIIESLGLSKKLNNNAKNWLESTIAKIGIKSETTGYEIVDGPTLEDRLKSFQFNTQAMSTAANAKRRIANLRTLVSNISQNTNTNELTTKLEELKNRLEVELKRPQNFKYNNSSSVVDDIRTEVKRLIGQKSIRELLAGIQGSLKNSLESEIQELSSILQIPQMY